TDDNGRRQVRTLHVDAEQRGDVTRQAQYRQAIAAVGRDLQVENVVVELQVFADRLAGLGGRIEFEQAVGLVGQRQLLGRTEHAETVDTAQLRLRDFHAAGQAPADQRTRRVQTDPGV